MVPATLHAKPILTLRGTVPLNDLRHWWEVRQADPETVLAYADDAPKDFAELFDRIRTGEYLFYLAYHDNVVVGAMWLHDLVRESDGTPRAGWLGTYVVPDYRGWHTTQAMWRLVSKDMTTLGVRSMYIASHHANTRAHTVAEQHMNFHRVGVYPAFTLFGGIPTGCLILCMHKEDMAEAWALARTRASR